MSTLDPVEGKVKISSDTGGVDDAKSKLQSFGESIQRIGEIALGINLAHLAQQIGETAREAVAFSVNSASSIEQTRITMNAFTGSVEKGQKAMEILNAFSRNAPLIPLQDVFQAGQQLLGFGFGLGDLNDKLRVAGELSIASHTPLSVAVDLLARAKEGIFNLREFGQFGISREELEKFGVSFTKTGSLVNGSALLPALEKLAQSRFGNIFAAQAGTFAGSIQNIKDDLMRLSAAFLGVDENGNVSAGVFRDLSFAVHQMFEYIEGNQGNIIGFFKGFWNILGVIGSYLANVFSPVWKQVEAIYEKHKTTINELGKLLAVLLVGALVVVAETVKLVIEVALDLLEHFFQLADVITGILGPAIDYMSDHWKDFLDFYGQLGQNIKSISITIANDVIGMINAVINAINGLLHNQLFQGALRAVFHIDLGGATIPTIPTLSGGAAPSGAGVVSNNGNQNTAIGGFQPIQITNNNTFNNQSDVNAFSKSLGLQLALTR